MKISTEINSARRIIGEERAVELYAKAGFDAWDFSMFSMFTFAWNTRKVIVNETPLNTPDYLKFARRLKQIGLDNGIECNQSHAPFPTYDSIDGINDYIKRAIECTAEAGGKICILHPDTSKDVEGNKEFYERFMPFAKEHGVKIATENMWSWNSETNRADVTTCATAESFNEILNAVNDEDFVACLDLGHAEMMGDFANAKDLVYALGDKCQALHIHDNDRWHDSHQIPFSMDMDFPPIVKALHDIGYKGYFTLEADQYLTKFNADNIFDGMKDLAASARKLADMFEALD